MKFPKTLPETHKALLSTIADSFSQDTRIEGIGVSGSYASDSMDKYSDLDLVIAISPTHFEEVMSSRFELINKIEGKVAAFTGEHVGEPRLIIALFKPHAIHVDFKFVSLPDAAVRVDDTKVIWDRSGLLTKVFDNSTHQYPQPSPQWIEDRFWVWTHYAATKIARGEYFETVEFLSFLRSVVLSPLTLQQNGLTPSGVRKIEQRLPEFSQHLKETVVPPEKDALINALQCCISLYLKLRENEIDVDVQLEAQHLALHYVDQELMK